MFTASDMKSHIALMSNFGNDEYAYNYYLVNRNSRDLEMHDYQKIKKNYDKSKSTEYNNINRDLTKTITELNEWQKSLSGYLTDLERKLRDIDRNNPNNIEDYNDTVRSVAEMKKKQLEAILGKGSLQKTKYDLLQKQFKIDNPDGGGNNNNGLSSPNQALFSTARVLNGLTTGSGAGLNVGDIPSISNEEKFGMIEYQQESAVVNNNNIYTDDIDDDFDDYKILATAHGPQAIAQTYKVNPDTGYGYIEYKGPEGETGIRKMPLNNFSNSFVNYGNRTITDAAGITYPIEETNSVPTEIVAEWNTIFDGINALGTKK